MLNTRLGVAGSLVLVLAATAVAEQASGHDATFEFRATGVALGLGATWGEGTLYFQGDAYPFTVSGLTVHDLGVSVVEARGAVRNLASVEDFAGTYVAQVAGASAGGGVGAFTTRNQNRVVINATTIHKGMRLTAATGGFTVALTN